MSAPIACVQCEQPIPAMSKLAELVVSEGEAREQNWPGKSNPDGTVTVKMCIQCQIQRAEAAKQRSR